MDGAHGVDMVAPDDPLSPVPGGDVEPASYGWYGRFGGTSGAAPHVAGAFALLKQARPSASVAELEQALIDAALQDLATGDLPDPDIGWGKLRFFDAIDPAESGDVPDLRIGAVPVHGHELALAVHRIRRATVTDLRVDQHFVSSRSRHAEGRTPQGHAAGLAHVAPVEPNPGKATVRPRDEGRKSVLRGGLILVEPEWFSPGLATVG